MTIEPLVLVVSLLGAFLLGMLIALAVARVGQSATTSILRVRLEELSSISSKLGDLSRTLIVPHTRGAVGETFLMQLLQTYLPRSAFDTQFTFKDGTRADAVVRLGDRIVAIDSKFPLDRLRPLFLEEASPEKVDSELRKAFMPQIESIAGKYIKPAEGTLDFALMYVPSERVYYRAFVESQKLLETALDRRVVPVGPGALVLYLQTLAFARRGVELSRRGEEIAGAAAEILRSVDAVIAATDAARIHLRRLGSRIDAAGEAAEAARDAAGRLR